MGLEDVDDDDIFDVKIEEEEEERAEREGGLSRKTKSVVSGNNRKRKQRLLRCSSAAANAAGANAAEQQENKKRQLFKLERRMLEKKLQVGLARKRRRRLNRMGKDDHKSKHDKNVNEDNDDGDGLRYDMVSISSSFDARDYIEPMSSDERDMMTSIKEQRQQQHSHDHHHHHTKQQQQGEEDEEEEEEKDLLNLSKLKSMSFIDPSGLLSAKGDSTKTAQTKRQPSTPKEKDNNRKKNKNKNKNKKKTMKGDIDSGGDDDDERKSERINGKGKNNNNDTKKKKKKKKINNDHDDSSLSDAWNGVTGDELDFSKYNYTESTGDMGEMTTPSPGAETLALEEEGLQPSCSSEFDTDQKELVQRLTKGQFVLDGSLFDEFGSIIRPGGPVNLTGGGAYHIVYQVRLNNAAPLPEKMHWYDVSSWSQNRKTGKYIVTVANTIEACLFKVANKTISGLDKSFVREKPKYQPGYYICLDKKGIKLTDYVESQWDPSVKKSRIHQGLIEYGQVFLVTGIEEPMVYVSSPREGWFSLEHPDTEHPRARPCGPFAETRLDTIYNDRQINHHIQHCRIDVMYNHLYMIRAIPPSMPKGKILILSGYGRYASDWEQMGVIQTLYDNGYAVCAIDLPGEGESGGEYMLQSKGIKSQLVRVIIDGLNLSPVVVLSAHSSSWYGLPFALYNPTRIGGYIALSPLSQSHHLDSDYQFAKAKTLIIRGEKDVRAALAAKKLKLMPNVEDIIVPNADYTFYFEDPKLWVPKMLEFLNDL